MSRVLIGPHNAAGQAVTWADALVREGYEATSMALRRRPGARAVALPADLALPYPRLTTPRGRARRARRALRGRSHFALDGFVSLHGPAGSPLTLEEVQVLEALVPHLALVAHGSDVRDPVRHARDHEYSYFPLLEESFRRWLETSSASNRAVAEESGLPVFVSTPDQLVDLPEATWLPLAVDHRRWRAGPRPTRARPRVVHTPSSGMRGTEVIDPTLRELHDRGVVEYVRPTHVDPVDMPSLVASCDIVVDQIRSGFYGVTAVEGLVSGAIVLGSVSDRVRGLLPEDPGVLHTTPETLVARLEELLDSRGAWPDLVDRGRAYAATWHDGRASVRALEPFLSA